MQISNGKMRELLVEPGHVSRADFDAAAETAEREQFPLEAYLVEKGLISDSNLGQAVANGFDYRFVELGKVKVEEETLHLVPEAVARGRGVLAFGYKDGILQVAMRDPDDLEMRRFLEKRSGQPVQVFYATEADFEAALGRYERSVSEVLDDLLFRLEQPGLTATEKERGIILLVDTVLRYAYLNGASDVHLDPVEKGAVLRYRIDGVLHDVYRLDGAFVELVVSRIKILAKMRTDEHRSAQDGKLSFVVEGRSSCRSDQKKIDVRASVIPTVYGENAVMRLLTADNRSLALDDLGFSLDDSRKVNAAIRKSIGMILVTGPTGSGKTTTLYGILKLLNRREVNIATIEDPIEYSIEGITQIQVNPKTNLTFADGLRAIVRQDPNIIMVGEIRDHETADIAVNSAMTGHLVLSTLHTNNAAIALPRLLDMGIEPFLLSSTIDIIIAQRLVRKVCENCRVSYPLPEEEKELLRSQPYRQKRAMRWTNQELDAVRLYRGTGCKACEQTGYLGRIGIFEVLVLDARIREAILRRASSDEIMERAAAGGMTTMFEDGIDKAWQGLTTLAEVLRVASGEYPGSS